MPPHRSKSLSSGAARAFLTLLVLACAALPLHAAKEEAHVLTLYGVDPYLPPFLAMDRAMRATVTGKADGQIQFFSESLDSQRFAMEGREPEFAALLARKYEALHVDVVVAVSRTALDFFERHGERLWPGARLVFVGFLGHEFGSPALRPGASAVVSILDAAGTIDIARRLQPEARRIVVVCGAAEVDRRAEKQAREALAKLDRRVAVEFLSGLPLPELVSRVAAEPSDSIVVYLAQFRDRDGRPYEPLEVLRAVIATSGAPVYGAAEPYIGLGVVAGSVSSYETKGRLIGEQVARALAGEPPDASQAVLAAPDRCVADARELNRWSLDPGRLARDCDIRFAEVPIWRQYGWQIALALAVIVAQATLIGALLSQRHRRRLAEERELAERTALARAARLTMAGELTGAIAHEINQPLGAILANADTAELMLDSGRDRRDDLRAILDSIRRDDLRASEVIRRVRDLLGRHVSERAAVDLNAIVRELESLMQSEARRRAVALEIQEAPQPLIIMGDRIQLQQVLINLVLNAMDAVADEPPERRSVAVSLAQGEGGALLAVRDRGHGIAPEHLPKVFESFFSTKNNGMGLGLSITRTIVEAHGGRIRAESAPGRDTVFRAEFPLADAATTAATPPAR
jgi:signal transduction histidine kinase